MKGKFDSNPTRPGVAFHTRGFGREEAEALALELLGHLAADEARLLRFLEASGLDPASLRRAAAEPGFLAGVLDHVMGDEALVLESAEALGRPPEAIGRAWALLCAPPEPD